MNIEYCKINNVTKKEVEALFLSVNWLSGKYPDRLIKALDTDEQRGYQA